jgi:hypothetical protein
MTRLPSMMRNPSSGDPEVGRLRDLATRLGDMPMSWTLLEEAARRETWAWNSAGATSS